jgi:hypothetical protein
VGQGDGKHVAEPGKNACFNLNIGFVCFKVHLTPLEEFLFEFLTRLNFSQRPMVINEI